MEDLLELGKEDDSLVGSTGFLKVWDLQLTELFPQWCLGHEQGTPYSVQQLEAVFRRRSGGE